LVAPLVPDVFLVLANLRDKSGLTKSPILPILEAADPQRFEQLMGNRFSSKIALAKDIRSLSELVKIVDQPASTFWTSQAIPKVAAFLDSGAIARPEFEQCLVKLASICHELLSFLPFPSDDDIFQSGSPKEFMSRAVHFNAVNGDTVDRDIRAEVQMDFAALESWWNRQHNGVTQEMVVAAVNADMALRRIVHPKELETTSNSKLSRLNRAANTPTYKRMRARMGSTTFSIYDNIFQAFCDTSAAPRDVRERVPDIEIVYSDDDTRPPFAIRKAELPEFTPILDLLARIHKLMPRLDLVSSEFSQHVLPRLAVPSLTIGRFSRAVSTIWWYPFLFSLDLRLLFCKLAALDVPFAMCTIHQEFVDTTDETKFDVLHLQCCVRRDALFEDGLIVIEKLGPGRCHFEIQFDGESGLGKGPTQEFMTLFSLELCRNARNLWISGPGEFASAPNGLFPRPDADPRLFYAIGVLCGKAVAMNCQLSIPFNPVFFEIAHGSVPDSVYARIDGGLVSSLKSPDGLLGLPFVYPGSEMELVENGSELFVSAQNFDVFVTKVKEAMLCRPLVAQFRAGFETVIPWEATSVFSSSELLMLILGGSSTDFEMADLEKYVTISHGYQANSPQIRMLFEILVEFGPGQRQDFVQFVTGARHLPYGGLRALRPKLTVAMKASDCVAEVHLPSVMTCVNYLKLPPYPNKEMMREKLLFAIQEGQLSFDLT
jgi:E3 ubiquitin-protein ligase TRIP12